MLTLEGAPAGLSRATILKKRVGYRSATRRIEGDEQGPQAPRVPLRRPDRLLRVHASRRARERPHNVVLPVQGADVIDARSQLGNDRPHRTTTQPSEEFVSGVRR